MLAVHRQNVKLSCEMCFCQVSVWSHPMPQPFMNMSPAALSDSECSFDMFKHVLTYVDTDFCDLLLVNLWKKQRVWMRGCD